MEPRRGTIQRVDMNLDRRSQSRAGSVIILYAGRSGAGSGLDLLPSKYGIERGRQCGCGEYACSHVDQTSLNDLIRLP